MELTLCPGFGCPKRESCLRFLERPDSRWQSFADFESIPWGEVGCDYFVPSYAQESFIGDQTHETVRRKPYPGRAA
jgi:hypothetical protein